jgi:hypothetical protein
VVLVWHNRDWLGKILKIKKNGPLRGHDVLKIIGYWFSKSVFHPRVVHFLSDHSQCTAPIGTDGAPAPSFPTWLS